MEIASVVDEGLGDGAHVVDLGDGGALVVDPERDTRPYLTEVDRRGLVPRFVVETHVHADFVAGERAMSAASLLERAGHRDLAVLAGSPRDLAELETGRRA